MRLQYKPVVWLLCWCPECGHEQEAEKEHFQQAGASCESCGAPTQPAPEQPAGAT